jgi:putative transposase/transposase-like zinc-binding protein
MTRPPLAVADVVRQYGDAYLARYGAVTSTAQRRVLQAVAQCRTAVLGGHKAHCDHCGHEEISYNSCRNRHCPKCQGRAQATWLAARERELLDVPYCHVVFTLPAALSPLGLQNPRVVYTLLFQAVAETLQTIARDPKHLGAEIGFLGVLHTWGQTLHHHPHIHCLVPAGGLALDGTAWVPCPKRFFLPVRVLSRLFRRTFLTALRQAAAQERLSMQGQCQRWHAPPAWHQFLTTIQHTEWVVYAKPPLPGPQRVLRYLARYTHRVAITNRRLLACDDGKVTFRWKDYQRGNRQRLMTLDAVEFIRRFLLHVLPRGFKRMRDYGLFANGVRKVKLPLCRQLLGQAPLPPEETSPPVDALATASKPHPRSDGCPVCRVGRMQVQETWFSQRTARDVSRPVLVCDTS